MQNNLDLLLEEGIIDEILGRLKSGKEADVFRVVYRGQVIAAKVYKDREQRSFKHNASYKEGRKVRNSRTQRAMDKGSRFGRDEAEDAWKSSEAHALQLLHTHGVRVPTPVMFYGGVLLMELCTDADGDIAPRLIDAPLSPEHAGALYRDLRQQIVGMLCCDLIHGDLSPYNVLLAAAGPTLIDFPQTISAAHNSQSERFFQRDLDNILRFLAGLDRRLNAHRSDGRDIWRAYASRELTPDFVPAAREYRPPPPPPARPAATPPFAQQTPRPQQARWDRGPEASRSQGARGQHAPQAHPQARGLQAPQHGEQGSETRPQPHADQARPQQRGEHGAEARPQQHGDQARPQQHGDQARPQQRGQHADQARPQQHGQHGSQARPQQRREDGSQARRQQPGEHGSQARPQQHPEHGSQARPQQHAQREPQPSSQQLSQRPHRGAQGPQRAPESAPTVQTVHRGAPDFAPSPARSAPREGPRQAGRTPVVVYVKRSAPREPAPGSDETPQQQGQTGDGRHDRGRRR